MICKCVSFLLKENMAAVATAQSNKRKVESNPPSIKKQKPSLIEKLPDHVCRAKDLPERVKTLSYDTPTQGGKGQKLSALQPVKGDTGHRFTVILEGSGYVPKKYGFDTSSEYGSSSLSLPILDAAEIAGLKALDDDLLDRAVDPKWWAECAERDELPPDRATIARAYNRTIKVGKPKDKSKPAGDRWPHKLKVGIVMDDSTGEPKFARIVDQDRKPVSVHDLPGKKWKRMIFECHYVYFKPPMEMGIVKRLKYLMVDTNASSDENPEIYDQLDYLDQPDPVPAAKIVTPEELGDGEGTGHNGGDSGDAGCGDGGLPPPLEVGAPPPESGEHSQDAPKQDDLADLFGEENAPKKKRAKKA